MRRSAGTSGALAVIAGLILCACSGEDGEYIKVGGGGFVFNYRIAEATAGIVAEPTRELPGGATIEAAFENPLGGEAVTVTKAVTPGRKRYSFVTPPLFGITAGQDYGVSVRVVDDAGTVLQVIEESIRSELDQAVLPEAPLTMGPGYAVTRAPR